MADESTQLGGSECPVTSAEAELVGAPGQYAVGDCRLLALPMEDGGFAVSMHLRKAGQVTSTVTVRGFVGVDDARRLAGVLLQ